MPWRAFVDDIAWFPVFFTVKTGGKVMQTSRLSSKGQVTLPREVRKAIGAEAGDTIGYEVEDNVVRLKKLEPFDAAFHKALSNTLDEWATEADEEAFRDL